MEWSACGPTWSTLSPGISLTPLSPAALVECTEPNSVRTPAGTAPAIASACCVAPPTSVQG